MQYHFLLYAIQSKTRCVLDFSYFRARQDRFASYIPGGKQGSIGSKPFVSIRMSWLTVAGYARGGEVIHIIQAPELGVCSSLQTARGRTRSKLMPKSLREISRRLH